MGFPSSARLFPNLIDPYFKISSTVKTCVKRRLKNRQNKDLNNNWLQNEGKKYCRMLHGLENQFFGLFESGRFTQVLLYPETHICFCLVKP